MCLVVPSFLFAPLRSALALFLVSGSCLVAPAAIIGNYDLTGGNFTNSSGSLGALSTVGGNGSFSPSGWSWTGATSPGTGLTIGGLPANASGNTTFGDYTIGLRFSLGQVSGFRRVIYFKPSDYGQYVSAGQFQFYNDITNPTGNITFSANQTVDFLLTRNATSGTTTAYMNGNSTALFSFNDGDDDAETSSGNRSLQFFRDDGSEFSNSGNVELIRIWDAPLSAAEIPNAMIPVPEPAAAVLLAAAGGTLLIVLHRRRQRMS